MTFAAAVAIAISFWGARHVDTPCAPSPIVVQDSELPTPNGIPALAATYGRTGPYGYCKVLISHDLQQWRTYDPGYYAVVIIHEVGHIDGIGHIPGGIMDANGTPRYRTAYPLEVRQVVARMKQYCQIPQGGYERCHGS